MTNQPVSIAQEPWQTTNLKRLGSFYGGLSGKSKEHFGSGRAQYVPFVNVMANLRIDPNALEQVDVADNEYQNPVRFGDLLFNGSSETPEEVGLCSVIDFEPGKLFLNSFCFGFRPFSLDHFDGVFFAYLFRSSIGRQIMVGLAQGSTRYNLSKPKLLAAELLVPSVQEQRSIAALLTDVDLEIDSLDALIAKKRNIKQGAMQKLWSQSQSWNQIEVHQVLLDHFSGPSPTCEERNIRGSEWGVLRTTCTTWEYGWNWKSHKVLPPSYWGQESRKVRVGDTIITKAGPRHRVGVSSFVDFVPDNIVPSGKMIALRPNPSLIHPLFLSLALKEHSSQAYLNERTTGMAESQVNFENRALLGTLIKVPSLGEQMRIAEVSTNIDAEIKALVALREKTALIKIGMMQELLTGRTRLL